MDYVLDDSSTDASALWLDAWSLGRRNPGEFRAGDPEVAARRLLTMIDGLGTQQVVRAVASDELKHIDRAYVASELGV